jgi:hypothetical protein
MTGQVFNTNTWLWNENVLQYSSILSVEPQTGNFQFEALVHFATKGKIQEENIKCIVLVNNKRVLNIRASEVFFMV